MTSTVSLPIEPEFKLQIRWRDDYSHGKIRNVVLLFLPGSLVPQFKFTFQDFFQI